jgi:hypothetical protein
MSNISKGDSVIIVSDIWSVAIQDAIKNNKKVTGVVEWVSGSIVRVGTIKIDGEILRYTHLSIVGQEFKLQTSLHHFKLDTSVVKK